MTGRLGYIGGGGVVISVRPLGTVSSLVEVGCLIWVAGIRVLPLFDHQLAAIVFDWFPGA